MNTYTTEEEQVEAIKKWWKENGLSVAAGIVLGVSLLFGWRAWQEYDQQQAETASLQYEQVLLSVEQNNSERLREAANVLLTNYSNSPYATLAALALAKQAVSDKNLEVAHAHLKWVLDNGQPATMIHIARLRKAQIFIDQAQFDAAQQLINTVPKKGQFASAYAELTGDIAVAQGKVESARIAYQEALGDEQLSPPHRELVQMKLNHLGNSEALQVIADAPIFPESEEESSETGNSETESEPAAMLTPAAIEVVATPSTQAEAEPLPTVAAMPPEAAPESPTALTSLESVATPVTVSQAEAMPVVEETVLAESALESTETVAVVTETLPVLHATTVTPSTTTDSVETVIEQSAPSSHTVPSSNITQTHIPPPVADTATPASVEPAKVADPLIKSLPLKMVTTTHLPQPTAETATPSTTTDTRISLEPQE